MYTDIPIWLSLIFLFGGLAALAWSSDVFIDGAACVAKKLGISPFIIGMVIIGFGTSAPELCVSAMSGFSGHANLSLGNAYGSCNFNIAIILGVAALILPLVVKPAITFVAAPALVVMTLVSMLLLMDGECTRLDAAILLGMFFIALPAYCWFDQHGRKEGKPDESQDALPSMGFFKAIIKLVVGLVVLVGSSHFLVWGAVDFAKFIGVSDLVIGLTIVAIGTSLPELASAIQSARKGEHEFVLGNIIGSNFFNTLAVVGIATFISPVDATNGGFSKYILTRDLPLMLLFSLSISVFGVNWRRPREAGRIITWEALVWILAFLAYTVLMILQETH